ncbi:MAG: bifunctional folylpolyglutamate synthase/dihydrofolate synthase, partial [Actinomycetia bacterium]|nr:bifunctional folylpolyglutamate synthase/dihydrofolate synthase [Actinomycetes bacterium]
KGSTISFLTEILKKNGYNVGSYTSPHLFKVTERIRINGNPISEDEMSKVLLKVKKEADKIGDMEHFEYPTYFEVLTAAAFQYLSEKALDFCLIEVGIEGKFDATNVFKPLLTVITNIEKEHESFLGTNLNSIAEEAVQIIKDGTSVVSCEKKQKIIEILKKECKKKAAKLYLPGKDFNYQEKDFNREEQRFDYSGLNFNFKNLTLSLLGKHQIVNASCAIASAEVLKEKGYEISKKLIENGLKEAKWRGRFEVISKNPLIIADGAHNPKCIQILSEALKRHYPGKKVLLIMGVLKDKDLEEMFENLPFPIRLVIATQPENERALDYKELYAKLSKYFNKVIEKKKISEAIKEAILRVEDDMVILITGSLMTVAEALSFFKLTENREQ